MKRIGEFLGPALERLRDPRASAAWLRAVWPSVVGETMAAHLRPAGGRRGTLRLEADSREWKKQAELVRDELLKRVNQRWGGALVREVEVAIRAAGPRLPYEIDNEHVPFVRRRAKAEP